MQSALMPSPPLTAACSHMRVQAELLAELEGDMFDLRDQLTQAAGVMEAGGLLWVLSCPVCGSDGPCHVSSMLVFKVLLMSAYVCCTVTFSKLIRCL